LQTPDATPRGLRDEKLHCPNRVTEVTGGGVEVDREIVMDEQIGKDFKEKEKKKAVKNRVTWGRKNGKLPNPYERGSGALSLKYKTVSKQPRVWKDKRGRQALAIDTVTGVALTTDDGDLKRLTHRGNNRA